MALNASSFLTKKVGPLPVYAYGAAIALGAGAIILLRRRGGGGSSDPTTGSRAANSADEQGSLFGGGSGGGAGSSSDLGGPTSGLAPGGSFYPGAPADQAGGAFMPSPGALSTAPSTSAVPASNSYYGTPESPIYRSQPLPDIGATPAASVTSVTRVTNPAGTALGLSQQPQNIYTPSALDMATEQPGVVAQVQAGVPGGPSGATYTIYSAPGVAGTGPVVPVGNRIAGERYDASGRVIL